MKPDNYIKENGDWAYPIREATQDSWVETARSIQNAMHDKKQRPISSIYEEELRTEIALFKIGQNIRELN